MGQPLLNTDRAPVRAAVRAPTVPRLTLVERDGDGRQALEDFLESRFEKAFGARLRNHYPRIAGLLDPQGDVVAAAGVRFGSDERLFLEAYLDHPVEHLLRPVFGPDIDRDQVVEIGSLASRGPIAALQFFALLAECLTPTSGRRFAVATVTPRLAGLLRRAGVEMTQLADADPARVGCASIDWGSYYDGGPVVVAGEIGQPPIISDFGVRIADRSDGNIAR